MTAAELRSLATLACLLLVIWELIKTHWAGAVLSMFAIALLVGTSSRIVPLLSAVLVLPIVFEERWNTRARKDMMRACLAALIIGANCALVIVY
jgi:hypothetical protein